VSRSEKKSLIERSKLSSRQRGDEVKAPQRREKEKEREKGWIGLRPAIKSLLFGGLCAVCAAKDG
jgi:hypothetical protein